MRRWAVPAGIATGIATGIAAATLTGCAPVASPPPPSASTATPAAPSTPSPAAVSPTPSPTPPSSTPPSPSPTARTSVLTGLPEPSAGPVLVVKLDNTRNAQPHAGLDQADVVYLEEVEYGITRIAAVFSSTIPDRIGPVRSARITDLDLLAQYGHPAFAFSGAQRKLWPAIADSGLTDISPNKGVQGYARDHSRRAPYNYFLDGRSGLERAPDASDSHDLGLVFAQAAPPGGRPVDRANMAWSEASAKFTYTPDGHYRVNLNGKRARAEGKGDGQFADTVVIQYVTQRPSKYFDKGGGNTPHAQTIGEGTAVILRDGLAYDVTWSRPDAASGTTFTMGDGSPMPFKPGQQWIVLLNRKTPATFRELSPSSAATDQAAPSPSR